MLIAAAEWRSISAEKSQGRIQEKLAAGLLQHSEDASSLCPGDR
jgi:hypothetical protein